ncbi:MAG TPA: F0F1 ATP synthase subunit delta [Burkholderiales bacterium]|nr:F0F1 ATP synthase subunit delta [Burkholderiales bacterium]
MAELVTIARPYAEAVFRLAKEQSALAKWSDALDFLVSVHEDSTMQAALADPKVTSADIERLLLAVCGERIDGAARNLVQILIQNRRLAALPEIRRLFQELKARDEGTVEAKIFSAYPIDDAQLEQVVALLSKRFQKKISAEVSLDPELIGGIKVEVGDKVWDASVRGRLQSMAATLTK